MGYSWTEYQSTAEVWRVCILVMSGSICLLFADDAVFLTSLEFALEQFAAEYDALSVSVRGQSTLNGQNYVDPQTNYVNIRTLCPYVIVEQLFPKLWAL